MARAKKTNSKKNSQNLKIVIGLIASIILLIGGAFAWYVVTLTGESKNVIKAGTLSLTLNNVDGVTTESTGISLNTDIAVPMTLSQLKSIATYTPYSFTLRNDGTVASKYTIYLVDSTLEENETRMADSIVGFSLDGTTENLLSSLTTKVDNGIKKRVLATGTLEAGATTNITLDLWIDKTAGNDVMGQVFRGHIEIVGEQKNYTSTETTAN